MMSSLKRSGLVVAVCLLAGCGSGGAGKSGGTGKASVKPVSVQKVMPATSSPSVSGPTRIQDRTGETPAVAGCDRELKALKRLDSKRYALRRAQFDRLMSGAAVYADIRTEVAGGTREAVDAMYRFRTGKLCSEISRDVLDALARQGEISDR
ncbi:hypothetical protein D6J78_12700 [Salmonella enterica subsp. enterica serovar Abaetetuba]|nr:hypothetical protein [Salmonella enterica subsp. enterica serovar Abaetetuba]ECC6794393.1 hypothetical protein [Salmonella enterica]ECE0472908.1 hypothetical protein [Salmonella enterica subsp. enterica serovar Glostrup]ECD1969206.1 hypothetical protein [Salmonella enterica subsp. enterica serovar Abaetetuba]EHA9227485.1 hypothetical protein [Salmonella enterica subsp. enterica serovar Glostrup]